MTVDLSHRFHDGDRPPEEIHPANPEPGSGHVERLALKVPEAAQSFGVSERKVRDLIASRELRAFHVDRSVRVRTSDLEQYLSRLVEAEAS